MKKQKLQKQQQQNNNCFITKYHIKYRERKNTTATTLLSKSKLKISNDISIET